MRSANSTKPEPNAPLDRCEVEVTTGTWQFGTRIPAEDDRCAGGMLAVRLDSERGTNLWHADRVRSAVR